MAESRGVRNNNPGNIEYRPSTRWQGQMPHDPLIEARFVRFDTPENGIRALARVLLTYGNRHGLRTVAAIVNRWAPVNENDSRGYIDTVERWLFQKGVAPPGACLDLNDVKVLTELIKAIMTYENGRYPYSDAVVSEGVRRALPSGK